MQTYVDASSIIVEREMRRVHWRMLSWHRDAPSGTWPPKTGPEHKIISYVIVSSTFDCNKQLHRDDETTMYYSDGTNNAGAIAGHSIWGEPAGGTRAVLDFVCKAAP
jgi:hypothetical protein